MLDPIKKRLDTFVDGIVDDINQSTVVKNIKQEISEFENSAKELKNDIDETINDITKNNIAKIISSEFVESTQSLKEDVQGMKERLDLLIDKEKSKKDVLQFVQIGLNVVILICIFI